MLDFGREGQEVSVPGPRRRARPWVTVDVVVVARIHGRLSVLLVNRRNPPFEGCWAIPGGFVEPDEPLEAAARRELREETGYDASDINELGWVHPNPAIQSNRCYTYLARGLTEVGDPEPDPHESFELVRVPLGRIPELIDNREITHALVVTAFKLLDGYKPEP